MVCRMSPPVVLLAVAVTGDRMAPADAGCAAAPRSVTAKPDTKRTCTSFLMESPWRCCRVERDECLIASMKLQEEKRASAHFSRFAADLSRRSFGLHRSHVSANSPTHQLTNLPTRRMPLPP